MSLFMNLLESGISWGDYIVEEEEREYAPYLKMSLKQFEKAKQEAKGSKKFDSWNDWLAWATRLEKRRAEDAEFKERQKQRAEETAVVNMTPQEFDDFKQKAKKKERFENWDLWLKWATKLEKIRADAENKKRIDQLNSLFAERDDYINEPWLNFGDLEEQKDAIEWVEGLIISIKGGEQRLAATKRKEIKEKRTEIVKSLKMYLTANKIQKMIRMYQNTQRQEIDNMLNECFDAQNITDMPDMQENRYDLVCWVY
jgi:hypothetical protein